MERLLITSLPPSYSWINEEVPHSIGLKGFTSEEFYFLKDLSVLGDCTKNTGFIGTAFCAHTKSETHSWMQPLQMQSIEVACKLNEAFTVASAPAPTPTPVQEDAFEAAESEVEFEIVETVEQPVEAQDEPPVIEVPEPEEYNPITAEEEYDPLNPTPTPTPEAKDIFEDSAVREIIFEDDENEDPIEVITFDEPTQQAPETPAAPVVEKTPTPVDQDDETRGKLGLFVVGIAAMLILGVGAFFYFQESAPAAAPVPLPSDVAQVIEQPEPFVDESVQLADNPSEEPAHPLSPTPREEPTEPVSVDLFEVAEAEPSKIEPIASAPVEAILPVGTLLIESAPSGATLVVNGEDKGKTPATIEELQFGQYSIEYKLDGYVSELLNVTLDSEETKTVRTELRLPLGTLEIHTTPEGVDFQVVSIEGLDRVIHSGTTPATVPEVLEGRYDVQFTRSTWEDYSESVEVKFDEISRVDLVYPEGWVMITSIPDGASVFEKGVFIGKTPLRLKGLKEGIKHYNLKMEGYEDLETSTQIVAQSEKRIEGELLSWDREVNYSELDVPPTQLKTTLSNTQRLVGKNAHRFLVEFVISKEGVPEQIEVLETTYLRAHERLIKDISKWTFEPGMRKEHAVKTRVRLPIILGDASKLPPTVELARAEPEEE